jgi:hypothetical protein
MFFTKPVHFVLGFALMCLSQLAGQTRPATPVAPVSPGCSGFPTLSGGDNINTGDTRQWTGTGTRSNVNMSGGTLVVCGTLEILSGNMNGGTIFVEPGASFTLNSSLSSIGINIVNYGVVELEANNMNLNTSGTIWNFGDSLYFSGNGSHNINGDIITSNGSSTIFGQSIQVNGSGRFFVEPDSELRILGATSSDGTFLLSADSEMLIAGSFFSNSSHVWLMAENSVVTINGASSFNSTITYDGDPALGTFFFLNGPAAMNNVSTFDQVYICSPFLLGPSELGSAQADCNAFSSFGPGSGNGPLPVSLVGFTGELVNGQVMLEWETAAEINNAYFQIQRSADLNVWIDAARVQGLGTSTTGGFYSWSEIYQEGFDYYRLIQVDFDGTFEVFSPISLNGELSHNTNARVTFLEQHLRLEMQGAFTYRISDLQGRSLANGSANNGSLINKNMSGFILIRLDNGIHTEHFKFYLPQ